MMAALRLRRTRGQAAGSSEEEEAAERAATDGARPRRDGAAATRDARCFEAVAPPGAAARIEEEEARSMAVVLWRYAPFTGETERARARVRGKRGEV
jgi:hypothetical protein